MPGCWCCWHTAVCMVAVLGVSWALSPEPGKAMGPLLKTAAIAEVPSPPNGGQEP